MAYRTLTYLNQTGQPLLDYYEKLAPMGTVIRHNLAVKPGWEASTHLGSVNPFDKHPENGNWKTFMNGGNVIKFFIDNKSQLLKF